MSAALTATEGRRGAWTRDEAARAAALRKAFGSSYLVARAIGRSHSSVQSRLAKDGYTREDVRETRSRRPWTDDDKQELTSFLQYAPFQSVDLLQLADRIRRTPDTVAVQARALGFDPDALFAPPQVPANVVTLPVKSKNGFQSRKCLCCGGAFWSEGSWNRLCLRCKEEDERDE